MNEQTVDISFLLVLKDRMIVEVQADNAMPQASSHPR